MRSNRVPSIKQLGMLFTCVLRQINQYLKYIRVSKKEKQNLTFNSHLSISLFLYLTFLSFGIDYFSFIKVTIMVPFYQYEDGENFYSWEVTL